MKACYFVSLLKRSTLFLAVAVLLLPFCAHASQKEKAAVKKSVVGFFYCFSQKKYKQAYDMFSDSLKMEIPYGKFLEKSSDIRQADIKKFEIYDADEYLAKMHLRVNIKLVHEGSLYSAIYIGTCDAVKEKGQWKLAAVKLSSEKSKFLKKLDFTKE